MIKLRLLEPWRSRLLWLSLGLNVFAITLIATPFVWHHHPPGPPGFDMLINRMARDLPEPDATLFRDTMARERPWYELGRNRLEEARNEVAVAVSRQPFDAAGVRAALQAMQDRLHEGGVRFDDSLIMSLEQLSPEGRAKLAASVRRGSPRSSN